MKKIKTKESKKLLILDIVMIIVCIIYMNIILGALGITSVFWDIAIKLVFVIIEATIKYLGMVKTISGFITVILMILILITILVLLFAGLTFPLNVIFIAIRNAYKNSIKERTTFKEITDLEYYRENFEGISPATISIITDLKVEYNKDVVATIMKLYSNKNIDFQDDKIVILNLDNNNLKPSETSILNKLSESKNKRISETLKRESWTSLCMEEAQKEGYIVNKKSKKRFIIKLIVLILLLLVCKNVSNLEYEVNNDELFVGYESEEEMLNNSETLKDMFEITKDVISGVSTILAIFLPIYIAFWVISYKCNKIKFTRTRKGKILQEQIYGMKNFIHDFSNLDEASKEHVVLWDYFLIYAIVLEENSKIVDEICKYKSVKIPNDTI